jgi:putative pyruvate formate lyase activating enzyme
MHQQVGDLRWDAAGLAKRGVLVRHLVMPGQLDQSAAIFRWLAEEVSHDTFINIMGQYRPAHRVGRRQSDASGEAGPTYEEINHRPRADELEQAYELARRAGLWRFDK